MLVYRKKVLPRTNTLAYFSAEKKLALFDVLNGLSVQAYYVAHLDAVGSWSGT